MALPVAGVAGLQVSGDGKGMSIKLENEHSSPLQFRIATSIEAQLKLASDTPTQVVVTYHDGTRLEINWTSNDNWDRYDLKWNTSSVHYLKDVLQLSNGGHWYGGPELAQQTWPLSSNSYKMSPYLCGDVNQGFGSGMERYWLCSNKAVIHVPRDVPLWVEHWDNELCLQAQIADSPYESILSGQSPSLIYSVFVAKKNRISLKDFHLSVFRELYDTVKGIPDPLIIRKPIWTTWARYKAKITQRDVIEYATEIVNHEAGIAQLELDDAWATAYGDFEFDPVKFPNVPLMAEQLRQMKNIRLSLWVHPFVNPESKNGQDTRLRDYFVKNAQGEAAIANWWHGKAFVVDFTNPNATDWFVGQLERLKRLGVFSFKFDAGELNYLPTDFRLHNAESPNDFAKAYSEMANRLGTAIEVRVFSQTQRLPSLIRTLDRYSTWVDTGLITLLPVALNFGLLGYPFNLPDMIGGNDYGAFPDKELFIRWMQQYSIAPWQFDQETEDIFKDLQSLREEWNNYLIEKCEQCSDSGEPVIRPMWWTSEAEDALTSSNQFLIGDRLLIAPILEKGVIQRSVFLPIGKWRSGIDGKILNGPMLFNQGVPLNKLAWFERVIDGYHECVLV